MLVLTLIILVVLIALTVPVAAAIGLSALTIDALFSKLPLHLAFGEISWQTSTEFLLLTLPMFILMGEIILRSGIAPRMYGAMVHWLSWLPGGLMHANIASAALFSATSGSSVATAATIGTLAMPEIEKQGYNERLFLGSLAAGGTLGILIPPSINLIIYGLLTNTSVLELYLAALIPGIALAVFFSGVIIVLCLVRPALGGRSTRSTWRMRFSALPHLLPPIGIFLVVVGSIYAGLATPTEAASMGVVVTLIYVTVIGRFSFRMLQESLRGTLRTTAIIMIIIIAAMLLNFVLAALGLPKQLSAFVRGLELAPLNVLLAVIVMYVILGCFLETLSLTFLTVPFVVPLVVEMGFDPIWFGIVFIIMLEAALITPPVGVNLFVIQSVRRKGSATDVSLGAIPYLVGMFFLVALLIVFPDIALWLPRFGL